MGSIVTVDGVIVRRLISVGTQGPAGVVAASAPITYDGGTQTVGIDASGFVASVNGSTGAVVLTPADVVGPAVATDGAVAVFDGTTGKLIKQGGVLPFGFWTELGFFERTGPVGFASPVVEPSAGEWAVYDEFFIYAINCSTNNQSFNRQLFMRINNDSGNNYNWLRQGAFSNVSGAPTVFANSADAVNLIEWGTSPSTFINADCRSINYATIIRHANVWHVDSLGFGDISAATSRRTTRVTGSAVWLDNSDITQFSVGNTTGEFQPGFKYTVFGRLS